MKNITLVVIAMIAFLIAGCTTVVVTDNNNSLPTSTNNPRALPTAVKSLDSQTYSERIAIWKEKDEEALRSTAVDEASLKTILPRVEEVYEKFNKQPAGKLWRSNNLIAAPLDSSSGPDNGMTRIGGVMYQVIVNRSTLRNKYTISFRSTAPGNKFPKEHVDLNYNYEFDIFYIHRRSYVHPPLKGEETTKGEPVTDTASNINRLKDLLALSEKIAGI